MIVLHTSIIGTEHTFRERATWNWLKKHGPTLEEAGWDVRHAHLLSGQGHEFEYDAVIRNCWGTGDLLTFERDMVPHSLEDLLALKECDRSEVCAIDYPLTRCYLMDVSTVDGSPLTQMQWKGLAPSRALVCVNHLARLSMMHTELDPEDPTKGATWNDGSWEYSGGYPLGLTRFRRSLMERLPATWTPTHWLRLDSMISNVTARAGVRCHIHLPMAGHRRPIMKDGCAMRTRTEAERELPVLPNEALKVGYRLRLAAEHRRQPYHNEFPRVVVA